MDVELDWCRRSFLGQNPRPGVEEGGKRDALFKPNFMLWDFGDVRQKKGR